MRIIGYTSPNLSAAVPLNKISHVILERVRLTSTSPVTLANDQGWTDTTTDAQGNIIRGNVDALIARCHAAGVRVGMEVYNAYGSGGSAMAALFNNASQSQALINETMRLVNKHGFDFVDYDNENEGMIIANWSQFLVNLKAALGSKELCIFTHATKKLVNLAAVNALSWIDVGTYDYPGMYDVYWYMTPAQAANAMAGWAGAFPSVPKSKFVLSVSFAARHNGVGDWAAYNSFITASSPSGDSAVGTWTYNGVDGVRRKAEIVRDGGETPTAEPYGGMMAYVLNYDAYNIPSRSLLKAISDVLGGVAPPPPTTYRLTVTVLGQGSTTPVVGAYDVPAGQTVTMQAIPTTGWKFRSWSWPGNPDSAYTGWPENPTSWAMTGPISIVAVFDPITSPSPPGTGTTGPGIGALVLLTTAVILLSQGGKK